MALRLHYHDFGQGHPLLILHGLFGSSTNWKSIARRLAVSYRILSIDLRNHGASPHAEEMSYEDMAADVLAVMAEEGLSHAVLLGHSMGGKVAMSFALCFPEYIDALIAVDIAPVAYRDRYTGLIRAMRDLPLTSLVHRSEADQWLAARIEDPALRQFLLQNLVPRENGLRWRLDLDSIESNMQALLSFPQLADRSYDGAACFVGGGSSEYLLPKHREAILERFPRAQMIRIPGAGHWLHIESPEVFLSTVTEFLQQVL